VATVAQCEAAFGLLASRLSATDEQARKQAALDRSVSCTLTDLKVIFAARLVDGELIDIHQVAVADAQLRLTLTSDDLVALTDGSLGFPAAWASGRLRIDASVFDLLKLRTLL
jgi:hypothetical protein